jgi:hypothetical protein
MSAVRHVPGTPLQFRVVRRATQAGISSVTIMGSRYMLGRVEGTYAGIGGRGYVPVKPEVADEADALVSRANAYPKLVKALQEALESLDARNDDTGLDVVRQKLHGLLRDLGES